MYEFTSVDHFQMPGTSIVYAFEKSQIPTGIADLTVLVGEIVLIDGERFRVTRVDAHPVSENDSSTEPEDFGLLVERVD